MAQTLEEYVVSLGLKVDKAQEQRFNSALDNLGKTFAWLAAGLTAAAATIQATVVAVSKSFDNLYWASQRTNASVANIKAMNYAFSQMGSSGSEAQAALEGLSKALRTDPGKVKWLNAQGIATEGRDQVEILSDIFSKFGKMSYVMGHQFADVVNINEETFNKAGKQWPQFLAFMEEAKKTYARFGVDPDAAAKSSHELMTKFGELQLSLSALLDKVIVALQPQLNQLMADISKWFEEHQDQIVKIMNNVLEAVKGLVTDFGELLKKLQPVADKFAEMVDLLTGEKNSLKAALELLVGGAFLAFTVAWGVFLASLAGNPAFWALVGLAGAGAYAYLMTVQPQQETVGASLGGPPKQVEGGGTLWGKYGPGGWYWSGKGNPATRRTRGLHGGPGGEDPAGGDPSSGAKVDGVNADLMQRYNKMIADAPEEVRKAIKLNSGFRTRAEQEALYKKYGPGRAARPGHSPHETGEALDIGMSTPEAKAWVHAHAKEFGLTFPLADEDWHAERAERRGRNPNWKDDATRLKDKQSELFGGPALGASSARMAAINNRTSITVYGSSDPAGTAANLNGAQSRVASELIRNGQSAFV